MANEIKDKFSSSTAMTITLAGLGSSASLVGRQSTLVDNTTARYGRLLVYYNIKLGTSPTGNKSIFFYLIRGDDDATPHRDGSAGASDAAWTAQEGMAPVWVERDKASPSTGDVIKGSFIVDIPGPEWGIGVVHDTGVNLDSTGGNHWVRYVGLNPEVQ